MQCRGKLSDEQIENLKYLDSQEWDPVERLCLNRLKFVARNENSSYIFSREDLACELIKGLGDLCDSPIEQPFRKALEDIEEYINMLAEKEEPYTPNELSTIIPLLKDLKQNHKNNEFWGYAFEIIEPDVDSILERLKEYNTDEAQPKSTITISQAAKSAMEASPTISEVTAFGKEFDEQGKIGEYKDGQE